MTQRQLASVLFAVLGIFLAITWVPQLFLSADLLVQRNAATGIDPGYARAYVLSMAVAVLLGIGLVLSRNCLAHRLFPEGGGPLVARDSLAVALAALGCYFAVDGLAHLFRFADSQLQWPGVAQLVLGSGLFVGARGLARLWTFLRTAGTGRDERAA